MSIPLATIGHDMKTVRFETIDSKEKIEKTSPSNMFSILASLLKKSSIYAVAQLAHSPNLIHRILWAVMLVIGVIGLIYEVYRFLSLYFQYPVIITLDVQTDRMLHFPGVTVCNLNRMKSDYVPCMKPNVDLNSCIAEVDDEKVHSGKSSPPSEQAPQLSNSSNLQLSGFSEDQNKFTYGTLRKEKVDLLNTYNNVDAKYRESVGYKANELIAGCAFNGEMCSYRNFSYFQSLQYGNCFTFNGKKTDETPLKTKFTGSSSGLELLLDLRVDTYMKLTAAIGARIMIHEPVVDPNPDDYGVNLSPGTETSISMEMNVIQRLPMPYRDRCQNYDSNDKEFLNYGSSYEMCTKLCIQSLTFTDCSCVDPSFSSETDVPRCNLSDPDQVNCLNKVLESAIEDSCNCPLPCRTTNYALTISTAAWPPPYFQSELEEPMELRIQTDIPERKQFTSDHQFRHDFENISKDNSPNIYVTAKGIAEDQLAIWNQEVILQTKNSDSTTSSSTPISEAKSKRSLRDDDLKEIRENKAKVKVFYKTLEVKSYRQEPMYQASELFSQLGGLMGLWLGLSLAAMFECIEGIMYLIQFVLCKSVFGTKKTSNENEI